MKSNESNTTPASAPEATTESAASLPAITREIIRSGITASATAIGCDRKKTVSGTELLVIFLRELEAQGVIPADYDRVRAMQVATHFDANSSAMSKRLYDKVGDPIDKVAAMAAMLSAPA